ncbi:hypothetical protein EPA93_31985 [Ktedonosporobacter rubrisoli]|uniref:Uncharacterized protein n=1 Tax=Ktedonosporobacter rubrisoli TaxID=2509675 RepID=A0A4P6JXI2_KTERU|nr:hypothetical protein [Ktedonosporobacter rubrisoli]QBD80344.1 hypothetical protein EPA93_31985 [Ktedonosporobacter rubrisoli]
MRFSLFKTRRQLSLLQPRLIGIAMLLCLLLSACSNLGLKLNTPEPTPAVSRIMPHDLLTPGFLTVGNYPNYPPRNR